MKDLNFFICKFVEMMHEIDASFDYSNLTADTNLEDIEGWSSLAAVFMVTMIDEEFSKEISAEQIKSAKTLKDIYNIICK